MKAVHILGFDSVQALVRAARQNANDEAAVPQYMLGEDELNLQLTLRTTDQRVGKFKVAQFGKCEPCPFETGEICAKQVIRTTLKSGQLATYEGGRQLRELLPEIQCLVWATTLHNVSMAWARDKLYDKQCRGESLCDADGREINIPNMRFVEGWLAKEIVQGPGIVPRVYLLEEIIKSKDGFCKYINNNSAVPLELGDAKRQDRALFLAFTQHFQYWYTRKMAFVTDFQGNIALSVKYFILTCRSSYLNFETGGLTLLTDPQIVTQPCALLISPSIAHQLI